jgi:carbon storage regulator
MLVLARKKGERITIGDGVEVIVLRIDKGIVRLGVSAPVDVRVVRTELLSRPLKFDDEVK